MGSLIDEALEDEQKFREKTARLFRSAGWPFTATQIADGRDPCGLYGVSCIRDRIGRYMRDGPAFKGQQARMRDIRALQHAEALDAAIWVREQLRR